MIQLTINIPDAYQQKASTLIAFLKTLDYVTLSETDKNIDFPLSENQLSILDKSRQTPIDECIMLEDFSNNFKAKYGI